MWAATRFLAEDQKALLHLKLKSLKSTRLFFVFLRDCFEFAEWEHRYDDIVALMKRAVKIDSADAKLTLGINLIDGEKSRRLSNCAKPGVETHNVRVYNTPELYDGPIARDYVTVEGARFRIRYHRVIEPLERYLPRCSMRRGHLSCCTAHLRRPWESRSTRTVSTSVCVPAGFRTSASRGLLLPNTGRSWTVGRSAELGMIARHELAHVFHIQQSNSRVPDGSPRGLPSTSRWWRGLNGSVRNTLRLPSLSM